MSVPQSMIERVAQTLADVNELDYDEFPEQHNALARAAINAMREPTDAMLSAGGRAILNADEDWKSNASWRAMIDAALNEQVTG